MGLDVPLWSSSELRNCSFLENGPRCQELVCKVDGFQSVLSLDKGVFVQYDNLENQMITQIKPGSLEKSEFP